VIPGRGGPAVGCVAVIAGRRELRGGVAGIGRGLIVGLVTGVTQGWRPAVRTRMTCYAGRRGMSPEQRERSLTVIKGRRLPRRGAVAVLAGLGEPGVLVIGIDSAVIVRLVASVTISRRPRITGSMT